MVGITALGTQRVMVCYDFSEPADRALAVGAQLGESLLVVHSLRTIDIDYPGLIWPEADDESRRAHTEKALRARLAGTGIDEEPAVVLLGHPGKQLCKFAETNTPDLIVIGSTGRTGRHILLGSVAEYVATHAPCPVLVLR